MIAPANQFLVHSTNDDPHTPTVRIVRPPEPAEPLTADDALCLAAWLAAIADPIGDRFPKVLDAVRNQ